MDDFLHVHELEYLRGAIEIVVEGTPVIRLFQQISRLGLSADLSDVLLSALEADTA
jgi:hypothetical protein